MKNSLIWVNPPGELLFYMEKIIVFILEYFIYRFRKLSSLLWWRHWWSRGGWDFSAQSCQRLQFDKTCCYWLDGSWQYFWGWEENEKRPITKEGSKGHVQKKEVPHSWRSWPGWCCYWPCSTTWLLQIWSWKVLEIPSFRNWKFVLKTSF